MTAFHMLSFFPCKLQGCLLPAGIQPLGLFTGKERGGGTIGDYLWKMNRLRGRGPGEKSLSLLMPTVCLYTKRYCALGKEVGGRQKGGASDLALIGGCRAPVCATGKLEVTFLLNASREGAIRSWNFAEIGRGKKTL